LELIPFFTITLSIQSFRVNTGFGGLLSYFFFLTRVLEDERERLAEREEEDLTRELEVERLLNRLDEEERRDIEEELLLTTEL